MKISIENFKSVCKVDDFPIKPMTVLSGVNSSGKSSFVQMILMIKKTLDDNAVNRVLSINQSTFKDLTYRQETVNTISFSITLSNSELKLPDNFIGNREVTLKIGYKLVDNDIRISEFNTIISESSVDEEKFLFISLSDEDKNYHVKMSNPLIFVQNYKNVSIEGSIDFTSIIPQILTDSEGDKYLFRLDWLKEGVQGIFNKIYHLGPVRARPREEYPHVETNSYVGESGQFTAQILKEYEDTEIIFFKLNEKNATKGKLLEAVNYWLCDEFEMGNEVFSVRNDDYYTLYIKDKNGLRIKINNVGYGISQVLPIIVQGLLMPKKAIIIVEQPEIHLHPKVQSLLYDFLNSLILADKKVIVETHSSHFITRMRRRIAEDMSNEMDDRINLTFIDNNLFRHMAFDDFGTILHYYPENFIEQPAKEMEAIIKAQIKKRKQNDR